MKVKVYFLASITVEDEELEADDPQYLVAVVEDELTSGSANISIYTADMRVEDVR